jgi:hypothetical protein
MASGSSGSATRSGSRSSASTPRTVKQELATAPRRNSGALVIREGGARTASPPHRRKVKKDAGAKAASDLAEAKARRAEEAAMEEAIQRSLRDVVSAKNTMPLDAALEMSRQEWEREEREQQWRLLDLAVARLPPLYLDAGRRRSSSWRSPATTSSTAQRRHVLATLGRAPAARRRRRRTTTPPTMTTATTSVSTAISACRTGVLV